MAVTYVGAASASSNSVSLPSFQAGDFAIVLAYAGGSAVSRPDGWTYIRSDTSNGYYHIGYRILQSGDTTTGTWTNATQIGVAVYSGVHQSFPFENAHTWNFLPTYSLSYSADTTLSINFNQILKAYASTLIVAVALSSTTGTNVKNLSTTSLPNNRTSGISVDNFGVCDGTSVPGFGSETYTTSLAAREVSITLPLREASAFPIVADADTTTGTVTSNSSSWTLTYPSNIAAGDLLVALVAVDGSSYRDGASPDGFDEWWSTGYSNVNLLIGRKKAAGTETGTFSLTVSASEQGSWLVYRIPRATWYGTTPAGFGTNTGSSLTATQTGSPSTSPDPPSWDPLGWDAENTLWIAAMAADTSRDITAYPTNFTNTAKYISGGSNGASLGVGRYEITPLAVGTDVDPDGGQAFGTTGSNQQIAASFVARSGALTKVEFYMRKAGSPGDSVYVGVASTKDGSAIHSTTISSSSITSEYTKFTWVITGGTLTFGSQYWLRFWRSGSLSADYYGVATPVGGNVSTESELQQYNGSTWSSVGSDLLFRLEFDRSSIDPGTFTISASDDWVAATIAIRPAAPPKSFPPIRPYFHLIRR